MYLILNLKMTMHMDSILFAITETLKTGTMNAWTSLKRLELLDLSGNNKLGNNILPNISGLPSLKYLRLGETGLTGQIELCDIMAIKNLKELDLSDNRITAFINYNGTAHATAKIHETETMKSPTSRTMLELLDLSLSPTLGNSILSTVHGLPSLKHLWLQSSGLTGLIELHDIEAIKSLEKLDLSTNSITGFVDYIGCGQMQKLEMLDLSENKLRTLPACWANLSSLQSLDVFDNQLTGDISLSPLIHLRSLQVLELSANKFQIPHSFKAFANHTKLKSFTADSNHVILDDSKEGVHPLAHGLQLMELVLSNCGLITYPPILRHQYNLRHIDLSHNTLKGDFPTWLLENNLQLRALFMRNNSLTGALRLPTFAHNRARVIDISENKVEGHIPPPTGTTLPQLRLLDVSNNEFNGDIPCSLCDIKPLLYLYLSDNQLSGGLGNLTKGCFNLRWLILSNNHFTGEFPSFYSLASLEILDLQGNNFSGKIVSKMFNSSLKVLNLSNTSLEGPIPQDLCTLRGLEELDLSHNKLNGLMPSCLLNSSQLHYVYLHDNRLSGHITHAIDGAPQLLTLDLSYNDLTSDVPAWIANLTMLNALLLRGNQFHSQIPDELCKLDSLSMLDLSYNSLSGAIPPCLSNMTFSLTKVYASYLIQEANVNGLPDWIVPASTHECQDCQLYRLQEHVHFTTKGMSYDYKGRILQLMSGIDLSCNKLTGEIPSEIGNLGNLLALNLSHNSLWGPIPATISNMNNLEGLDLSHNSLNGSIPTALAELDFLEVFKVVSNNLSGKIPFEAHFMTFDASSYEGNPFLCGLPLSVNCKTGELLPSSEPKEFEDGWMDMEIFYISFGASSTATFIVVVLVALWINPHLGNVWFYFAKTFALSGYHLMEDNISRLRRVGNV
ncbi:hypothetical protein Cgig2_027842 [Carnegiea gigantea]|uniref:Uncharacterized protein n=1 Tax=Carnegiea gigantea TaxID=171969 RepID=A0A9Q1QAZ2_9CARY|nr:hypothetical protein Cgig2_027842 [Carnegiea gigantea]